MRDATRFLLRVAALLLTLAPMVALAQICTGLCLQQVICPNPAVTTTISGTVYAPNGVDPLPGVLVYIPNGPVDPLPLGATCRNGGTPPSSPLVQAISGIDGKFTVNNMPVGTSIPLVIQSGKWRRQSVIPNVPSCTNTPIAAAKTRFPTRQSEGDMPNLAVVTGANDAQECILRKIGIVDSEFTNSNGAGRVKLFGGANSPGATYSAASASETVLEASFATLDSYDMVMFSCQGDQYAQTPTAQQNLINYANAGGRVMATHYAYTWLYNDAPFSSTATWVPDQLDITADPQTGYINTTFPDGYQLAQWLQYVGATTTQGELQLGTLRHDVNAVVAPSLLWIDVHDTPSGSVPMQYTFDTPVGNAAANQCGRVQFNDYHPVDAFSAGLTFPQECTAGAMTPQEKLFEYMLFNLTNNTEPALTLSIDDGRQFARYDNIANYTVNLVNNSPTAVSNIAVPSSLSPGLDTANTLCVGSGGATCTTSSLGGLTASATVAGNSTATWVISVPVLVSTTDTTVEMDVSTPGLPLATDVNTLVIFRDGYDVANADGTQ